MECPSCAFEVDDDLARQEDAVCPYCGYEFPPQRSSLRVMAWLLALLLAWPVFEVIRRFF